MTRWPAARDSDGTPGDGRTGDGRASPSPGFSFLWWCDLIDGAFSECHQSTRGVSRGFHGSPLDALVSNPRLVCHGPWGREGRVSQLPLQLLDPTRR